LTSSLPSNLAKESQGNGGINYGSNLKEQVFKVQTSEQGREQSIHDPDTDTKQHKSCWHGNNV
jgi:hypothetical protein